MRLAPSDLARLATLQRHAASVRGSLQTAAEEMTTGRRTGAAEGPAEASRLYALDRALARNAVFVDVIALAGMRLDAMQESLGRVQAPVEELALDLAAAVGLGDAEAGRRHAADARRAFVDAVGVFNGRVGGQTLFGGAATGTAALAPAEAMLAELDALAEGAADGDAAAAAIDAYFAPGGRFFAAGYLGSTDDLAPVQIGEGTQFAHDVRADGPEAVAVLRGLALAAVVDGPAFAGDAPAQLRLLAAAAERTGAAREQVLALRARTGAAQDALEAARAGRASERHALELAQAQIVAVDPLEAASRFQALEVQLQSIYAVTARLADLRFANFMR